MGGVTLSKVEWIANSDTASAITAGTLLVLADLCKQIIVKDKSAWGSSMLGNMYMAARGLDAATATMSDNIKPIPQTLQWICDRWTGVERLDGDVFYDASPGPNWLEHAHAAR